MSDFQILKFPILEIQALRRLNDPSDETKIPYQMKISGQNIP
jgi:hypothetical protein